MKRDHSLGRIAACALAWTWAACAAPAAGAPSPDHVVDLGSRGRLYVEAWEGEDIGDPGALAGLVRTMYARSDAEGQYPFGALLSLEEFFTGNRDPHCFGANLFDRAPHTTPAGWYGAFVALRELEGVRAVHVDNAELEFYPDGRVTTWPYTDSVVVLTTLGVDRIREEASALEASDVFELDAASLGDLDAALERAGFPPRRDADGAIRIWWD